MTKTLFLVLLTICMSALASPAAQNKYPHAVPGGRPVDPKYSPDGSGWHQFAPEGGGFSVSVPDDPTRATRIDTGEAGRQQGAQMFGFRASTFDFIVGFRSLPPDITSDDSKELILDQLRDGLISRAKYVLVEERKLTVASFPARRMRINTDVEQDVILLVVTDSKVLTLTVGTVGLNDRPDLQQSADTLFHSLKVKP